MSELWPEVLPLRDASRRLIRELGFLQPSIPAGLTHSQCHALLEIERAGHFAQHELAPMLRLDKSTTSRVVAQLQRRGFVRLDTDHRDRRRRVVTLTARGRERTARIHEEANVQVQRALDGLTAEERARVLEGIELYARALEHARRRARLRIRPIRPRDDKGIAHVIRTVMPEFGAVGPGFAINDPEVDRMSATYRAPRHAYYVVLDGGQVVGGAGIAPLAGGEPDVCELRKMYVLAEARGLGIGQQLMDLCLASAREHGFRRVYLETLESMTAARRLYERNGFTRASGALGNTGHFGCDSFYVKDLA